MFMRGIKATDLIKSLQYLVSQHGDLEVYAGGTDYPEGVKCVTYNAKERPYHPANTFEID